jgi:hypothetical protein
LGPKPAFALPLLLRVVQVSTCNVVPNALVDFWHAHAPGAYSGFANQGSNGRQICCAASNRRTPVQSAVLTSQLYFPQPLNRRINALQPYVLHGQNPTTNTQSDHEHPIRPRTPNPTTNTRDGIFNSANIMNVAASRPLWMEFTFGVA